MTVGELRAADGLRPVDSDRPRRRECGDLAAYHTVGLSIRHDCRIAVDLATVPLSAPFRAARGDDRTARLFAATGGDDYALLAALRPGVEDQVRKSLPSGAHLVRIGELVAGEGISLHDAGAPVDLPEHLGHEHQS